MASTYEQTYQSKPGSQIARADPPAMSVFRALSIEERTPIFTKEIMNMSLSNSITHAALGNDYLLLALANGTLVRRDLRKPDVFEEIAYTEFIPQKSKLSSLFLDLLGQHALLAVSPRVRSDGDPELFYLHRSSKKLRPVSKSRTYEVTAVGWNNGNTSLTSTGAILLGTSQGHILETEFVYENDKLYQSVRKHVFDVGKGSETPVTGIEFHRVGTTNKYIIMVSTPERLYPFVGYTNPDDKPLLQPIFNYYMNTPEIGFQEIPSNLKYSKLEFGYDKNKIPKTFAWLTEQGIFHGQLDLSSDKSANFLIINAGLLSYPKEEAEETAPIPLSFVLTEFHVLLIYPNKVKAICLLNQELVYDDTYPESRGKLKTILKDPVKQTILAVTDKSVLRYKVTREERNVWKIYCDKKQFDLAEQYCGDNPAYMDCINVKKAEMFFSQGLYEESAFAYSFTETGFETVCLKFLEIDKIEALKVYLEKRLENLEDEVLITMLVMWMYELYLSQLSELRRKGEENSTLYSLLQSDFEMFMLMPKVRRCMQNIKNVIYDLISSHGDKQNFTKCTILNEDFESVISQNIRRKSYLEALDVLKNQNKAPAYYEFAPALMQEVPKQMVDALIAVGHKLSPTRLLPAFLYCEKDEAHVVEIIRYLEHVMQNFYVGEQAIHNYLITLYCEYDQDALIRYLNKQGQELSEVNYDVHFALRLCKEKGATVASVKLSALLGAWEAAVELALGVDLKLAKSVADMPDSQQLKKTLWLKIAQHVISSRQEVGEATRLLEECSLLKIEDVLPLFSHVVSIDTFRQPICRALQEYNEKIEELKMEMEEATKSAEEVRKEIKSYRDRSIVVLVSDTCALCSATLLLSPFYLFPCGHKFHSACLIQEITPRLSDTKRGKLESLQRELCSLPRDAPGGARRGLRARIDDAAAAECPYCGEAPVQEIDRPFVDEQRWEAVASEWR